MESGIRDVPTVLDKRLNQITSQWVCASSHNTQFIEGPKGAHQSVFSPHLSMLPALQNFSLDSEVSRNLIDTLDVPLVYIYFDSDLSCSWLLLDADSTISHCVSYPPLANVTLGCRYVLWIDRSECQSQH